MEGSDKRDPILDSAIDELEKEDSQSPDESPQHLPPESAEDAADIIDDELPDDIIEGDESSEGAEDLGRLDGDPLFPSDNSNNGESDASSDASEPDGETPEEGSSGDDIDDLLAVGDDSEYDNDSSLTDGVESDAEGSGSDGLDDDIENGSGEVDADELGDDIQSDSGETEADESGDEVDEIDDLLAGTEDQPDEESGDVDFDHDGNDSEKDFDDEESDIDSLLDESDEEEEDPISDWTKDFDEEDDDTDDILSSDEDLPSFDEDDSEEESVDDQVVKGVFEETEEAEGDLDIPADRDADELAETMDRFSPMDNEMNQGSEMGKNPDVEPTSRDEHVVHSDQKSAEPESSSRDFTDEKKEGTGLNDKPSNSENQSGSKRHLGLGLIAGVVISALVIGGGYFAMKGGVLSSVLPVENKSSAAEEKITALEERVSKLSDLVSQEDGERKERFESLLSRYDAMMETQEQLSQEQERYSSLIRDVRSDLENYEEAMLERFKKVINFASNVSEKQTQQAQTIKDTVLREALAIMKEQESDPNGQKLSSLQNELQESERKMAQLEATVLAQRQMFSLLEDEMGYLKERVNRSAAGYSQGSRESLSTPPQKESDSREDKQASVVVEPDSGASENSPVTSTEERIKPPQFEHPRLHLVGVHAKANGTYDIYTQPQGAEAGVGIEPYWFSRSQASSIPGYGRILGVREIENSSRRVPYVVITEKGEIRGKE